MDDGSERSNVFFNSALASRMWGRQLFSAKIWTSRDSGVLPFFLDDYRVDQAINQ